MSCTHPLEAFRTASGAVVFTELARHGQVIPIRLACGQCQDCRLARSGHWAARIMHEASLYKHNCFLTLTYHPEYLPPNSSLQYRDFQLFMKRLRKEATSNENPLFNRYIRFYMCGEYGTINLRPHYHACLFNVAFPDQKYYKTSDQGHYIYHSPTLTRLWPWGTHSLGQLNSQTAAYTSRYIMQKVTGDLAPGHYGLRTPEFNCMSRRPGIGTGWLKRFHADVFTHDYLIVDGTKHGVPAFYNRLLKRTATAFRDELALDAAEQRLEDRKAKAFLHAADQTPERLAAKAAITRARISQLKRTLE